MSTSIKISADQDTSWLEQHKALSLVGSELDWLNQQRKDALARFEEVGLPGIRDEQWRYTNLRALKSHHYQIPQQLAEGDITLPTELPVTEHSRLVFVDGYLLESESQVSSTSGVSFGSLSNALADNDAGLSTAFGSCLAKQPHGFTALNTAYCQDGYVLNLDKGAVADGVLEVYFFTTQAETINHTRNLIIANANTQCTVVERHIGADGLVYINNSVTEIMAADNAHIDHYKIQQDSDDAFHIGGVFINQSANSNVKNHNVALNGLVTRNDVNCNLLGQGAHMEMNGLVLGKGRQHIDNHTEVNHAVPNCTSDEYYKTILDDQSRSVFRGRIIVAQDAQLTNADQQNNNLLLSKDAEADCKPQLEIYADDVKCSHGATVGQLDPKSLFYLQSRGINTESANALLTFAFANEVIERINVDSIREELTKVIAGELLSDLQDLV